MSDPPYPRPTGRDRIAVCNRCGKQRWAPRIPEALQGWLRLPNNGWRCAECQEELRTGVTGGAK